MKDINEIRSPLQTGFDPAVLKIILAVLAAALILAALLFFYKKYFGKRKAVDLESVVESLLPLQEAMEALESMLEKKNADPRPAYFRLTQILKRYIGRTFGVNAPEMTSQEFEKCLKGLEIERSVKEDMKEFQAGSDRVKYAGRDPGEERMKKDAGLVRKIIKKIEKGRVKKEAEE